MDDELRGVKGWLLTFVIIIAVISPVAVIILVMRDLYADPMVKASYGVLWPSIETFEWAHTAIIILAGWFVAYRLVFVHNWATVRITIAAIWVIAIGGVISEVAGVAIIAGIPVGDLLGASVGPEMVRPFIFCLIWTSYFLKSERVQNTYRGGAEQAEVFE